MLPRVCSDHGQALGQALTQLLPPVPLHWQCQRFQEGLGPTLRRWPCPSPCLSVTPPSARRCQGGSQSSLLAVFLPHFSSCLTYSVSQRVCFFLSSPPRQPLPPSPPFPLPRPPSPLPGPSCALSSRREGIPLPPPSTESWAWSAWEHRHVSFTSVSFIPLGGSSKLVKDEKNILFRLCRGWNQRAVACEGQGCCLRGFSNGLTQAGAWTRGSWGVGARGPGFGASLLLRGLGFLSCEVGLMPPTSRSYGRRK